jgi:hypothetical protein
VRLLLVLASVTALADSGATSGKYTLQQSEITGYVYGGAGEYIPTTGPAEEMNVNRFSGEVRPDMREPIEQALVNQPSKKYYYFLIPASEKARVGLTDNDAITNSIES